MTRGSTAGEVIGDQVLGILILCSGHFHHGAEASRILVRNEGPVRASYTRNDKPGGKPSW